MKIIFFKIAVCITLLSLFGCGYTLLERETAPRNPCQGKPDSTLPDLIISNILCVPHQEYGDNNRAPHDVTTFLITISNIGFARFEGSILFSYADNPRDVRAKRFPHHGEVQTIFPEPGDTLQVRINRHARWYPPGITLTFVLRTDSYPPHTYYPIYFFGREPVCEISYDNNEADLLIQ